MGDYSEWGKERIWGLAGGDLFHSRFPVVLCRLTIRMLYDKIALCNTR